MTGNNFNLSEFHHSIYLHSHLSEVYHYVASADGICRWFMGKAEYIDSDGNILNAADSARKEDTFNWHWLKKDLNINGRVIEAINNEVFSFTFGQLFEVTITIKEDKERTLLTLHQKYSAEGTEKMILLI